MSECVTRKFWTKKKFKKTFEDLWQEQKSQNGPSLIPYTCLTISRSLSPSSLNALSGVSLLLLLLLIAAAAAAATHSSLNQHPAGIVLILTHVFISLNLCSHSLVALVFAICISFNLPGLAEYAVNLVFVIHLEKWVCMVG